MYVCVLVSAFLYLCMSVCVCVRPPLGQLRRLFANCKCPSDGGLWRPFLNFLINVALAIYCHLVCAANYNGTWPLPNKQIDKERDRYICRESDCMLSKHLCSCHINIFSSPMCLRCGKLMYSTTRKNQTKIRENSSTSDEAG